MDRSQKPAGPGEPAGRSTTLTIQRKPKQTPEATHAELMVEGLGMNAATAVAYSRNLGELDLTECMAALVTETRRVQRGNMDGPEAMLAAQAVALTRCSHSSPTSRRR